MIATLAADTIVRTSTGEAVTFYMLGALALMAASSAITSPALADEAAAKKWIDSEFQPSTLSKDDQLKEMQWFIKAAEPFKGMEINAVSETLTVHEYESRTLAKNVTAQPKSPHPLTALPRTQYMSSTIHRATNTPTTCDV